MSTQTIRNGASITVNLQPSETLKVVAVSGTYTLTGRAGSVAGTTIAAAATGGTYGPYAAAVTVSLASSAQSEIDFDSGTAPVIESDTPAMVNTNPLTGRSRLIAGGVDIPFLTREDTTVLPTGQPIGLSRAATSMGKKIFGFASTDGWVKSIAGFGVEGTDYVTTEDYTGVDPATGLITGFASRTGATKLRKVQCLTTALIEIKRTSISVPINGKIGLWVYVDCAPGVTNPNLSLLISSVNGANANEYYFNNNVLKPNSWNFICVVRKANPTSNSDKEAHPFGLTETIGEFSSCQWVTQNLASLYIRTVGVPGVTFYFDSVWTGWQSTPQFVLGADMTGPDTTAYMLPKFKQYGWKGYIAQPYRVQTGGWADVSDWNAMLPITQTALDAVYSAGWDVCNHSVNHQAIGNYTDPTQIRFEINACRAWLATYGYNRGQEFYISPMGSSSVFSRKVIADCGIKMQRHGTHDANIVTAYGVDDLTHVGSIDIGGNGWIYNSVEPARYPFSYPHIQNLRTWVDMIIKYGAVGMPFWHGIKVLGDPGDGTGNSGDPVFMYKSTFDLFMDYIAEKEAAGLCVVTDGMTGFYYGTGR